MRDILDEIAEYTTSLRDDFANVKKTFKAMSKKMRKINELVEKLEYNDDGYDDDDEPEYPDKWYPGLP